MGTLLATRFWPQTGRVSESVTPARAEIELMRPSDIMSFGWRALAGYPARTWLTLLAMAIGVSAVVLLTALGEGARRFVVDQFAQPNRVK